MNDLVAENSLISTVLWYGSDGFHEVVDLVKPEMFTDINQVFWRSIEGVFCKNPNATLDYGMLYGAADAIGCAKLIEDNRKLLGKIKTSNKVDISNAREFAKKIVKCKVINDLQDCTLQSRVPVI
jgi:hypothetical protein